MEAEVPQDPQLILAQKIFLLRLAQNEPIEKQKLEIEILEEIFRKSKKFNCAMCCTWCRRKVS